MLLRLLRGYALERGVHGGGGSGLTPRRQAAVRAADACEGRAAGRRRPLEVLMVLLLRVETWGAVLLQLRFWLRAIWLLLLLLLLLLRLVVRGRRWVEMHR